MLCCLDVWRKGMSTRIRIERTRAKTPPSLLGIDRRLRMRIGNIIQV